MVYSDEQEKMISRIVEKLSENNQAVKDSPSTRVMAINLLTSLNWDLEKTLQSLK